MLDGDFASWWETGEDPEMPVGVIAWWPSSAGAIPAGWALCDGVANAPGPDLRGRFLVGADVDHVDGATGGARTHTHAAHPSLSHIASTTPAHFETPTLNQGYPAHPSQSHDVPNGEPPWTAGDWIQRMT